VGLASLAYKIKISGFICAGKHNAAFRFFSTDKKQKNRA